MAASTHDMVSKVMEDYDADVILFNAPISRQTAMRLYEQVAQHKCHSQVILFLVTEGGDPDAGYQIARFLQNRYERFIICVAGYCKSAGTLIALGAHEIHMGDLGEFGPLDVQLKNDDDIGGRGNSVLAVGEALRTLEVTAAKMFNRLVIDTINSTEGQISWKSAADPASKIVTGLLSHIYQQIDPHKLGHIARTQRISQAYGLRLALKSKNVKGNSIEEINNIIVQLSSGYQSHSFIIDYYECINFFNAIQPVSASLANLASLLGNDAIIPNSDKPVIDFLTGQDNSLSRGEKTNDRQPEPEAAT